MIEQHWDGECRLLPAPKTSRLGFVEGLNNRSVSSSAAPTGLADEEYLRLKILTCMLPAL